MVSVVYQSDTQIQPDFQHVSGEMLYYIARHTGSVLAAELLNRKRNASSVAEKNRWAARRLAIKNGIRALNPEDRDGLIQKERAWHDEILVLESENR